MVFGWFKKSKPPQARPEVYSGLRNQVFSLKPNEIGVSPSSEMPVVWGVIMEFRSSTAIVTLVSLADRTTSLYFSNGGGVIGAGEHEPVAQATATFISLAHKYHGQMQPTTSFPAPTPGNVRFYLLTFSGVLTFEANEQELGNQRHELSPLFHMAHGVIANVRMSTEKQTQ